MTFPDSKNWVCHGIKQLLPTAIATCRLSLIPTHPVGWTESQSNLLAVYIGSPIGSPSKKYSLSESWILDYVNLKTLIMSSNKLFRLKDKWLPPWIFKTMLAYLGKSINVVLCDPTLLCQP